MTSTKSSNRECDDLTLIKGIGEATDRWFRQSFKTQTFRDLAALSSGEIEARLKDSGRTTSRNKIEEWLVQARDLAGMSTRAPQRSGQSGNAQGAEKPRSPSGEGKWKPFASFIVEFQAYELAGQKTEQRTTVHRMENGGESASWPGIEEEQLCRWMLTKATGSTAKAKDLAMPESEENLYIKILNEKSGKASNNLSSKLLYELLLSIAEKATVELPRAGEKVSFAMTMAPIQKSSLPNSWTGVTEVSADGVMRLGSLPSVPHAGIYRIVAESENTDKKNKMYGSTVVNVY